LVSENKFLVPFDLRGRIGNALQAFPAAFSLLRPFPAAFGFLDDLRL
jgi:hypothetical protein